MLYVVMTIALIIVLAMLALIIRLEQSGKFNTHWETEAKQRLKDLDKRFNGRDLHVMKSLIIEADTLLDHCFQKKKLSGSTMGERLKSARQLFSREQYDDIWRAHKVRNQLVHEVSTQISLNKRVDSYHDLKSAIEKLL